MRDNPMPAVGEWHWPDFGEVVVNTVTAVLKMISRGGLRGRPVSASAGASAGDSPGHEGDCGPGDERFRVLDEAFVVAGVSAGVHDPCVGGESARGAVAGSPQLRFPGPLAEPDVRLSPHPALHGSLPLGDGLMQSTVSGCSVRASGSG